MRSSPVEQSKVALLSRLRRAQKPPEDGRGRLSQVQEGSGAGARTTGYFYGADGYLASVTDALNRTASFTRDADGRVLSTQLPDGRVVSASYDNNDNLLTLTPPGRPAHSFSYTSRDLTEQYTPPTATPGGPTSYSYNSDSQPVTKARADGDVVTSSYDLAGRLQTLTIPRGSFGYVYDGPTGKLANVTGPGGGTYSYTYQGSLLASLTSGGLVSGSATWTYDNNFRTTSRTLNGANGTAFGYDADDLATAVGSLTLSRNPQNGLLTSTTLGNVTASLSYSAFAEVSGHAAAAGPNELYSESYLRDNLGRITQRTEILEGTTTTWTYAYDVAGRLQSVTRNGTAFESYTYDPNDNRLTKTTTAGTTTFAHDNQDRLVSASGEGGAQIWVYDAHGDLVNRSNPSGTVGFNYDTTGQLLSVIKPGQLVSYDLDARDKRAVKLVNGVVRRKWLHTSGLLPVAEYDANDNLVSVFHGSYLVKNGITYRLLRDHLGSVRLVVDANTGAVAQRLSYGPWGEVLEDTNPGFQPFGYAGGLYDQDTGLVRFGARDYDPSVGRWTCKDPIGLEAGPNLYAYCDNDPINCVDPSGLQTLGELNWDEDVAEEVNSGGHFYAPSDLGTLSTGLVMSEIEAAQFVADLIPGGMFGKYWKVKGHHVHCKKAFEAHSKYSKGKALSLAHDYMKKRGWNHQKMTNYQREAFKRMANGEIPNTLTAHSAIAVEALVAGGASRPEARSIVAKSLNNLRNQGVYYPTNIPWSPGHPNPVGTLR